jgi:transcriptional regulator with XRE-family HTH domain
MTNIDQKFKENVGNRLRELREHKGLSIKETAKKLSEYYYCNIDEKSIRRYENGEFLPKIDNLICLAELYGSTLDYIVYGRETSDDNSFTWYDNFKRLNRLLYTMQMKMLRDKENTSNVYIQLLDDESKEWFGRIERYIDKRKNLFTHKGIEKDVDVRDLDALFKDFEKDRTQLLPIEERVKRSFLASKPIVTTRVQEENGEITITSKIQKR